MGVREKLGTKLERQLERRGGREGKIALLDMMDSEIARGGKSVGRREN